MEIEESDIGANDRNRWHFHFISDREAILAVEVDQFNDAFQRLDFFTRLYWLQIDFVEF